MRDKITALAAPPGHSLTGRPGKWAWERPARFSNPDDAIDYLTETISNGPNKTDMLKLMVAGITVEELVSQLAFKGFMAGAYTPDVAEIIKPAIGVFLYDMALEEGFEPQMFIDEGEPEGSVDDVTFYSILKKRNPQLYMDMNEERNRMLRMSDQETTRYSPVPVQENEQSFLSVQSEPKEDDE